MKCQGLFFWEKKKKKKIASVSAELAQKVVSLKQELELYSNQKSRFKL